MPCVVQMFTITLYIGCCFHYRKPTLNNTQNKALNNQAYLLLIKLLIAWFLLPPQLVVFISIYCLHYIVSIAGFISELCSGGGQKPPPPLK